MNRRSFFKSFTLAASGFAVLPSAVTYARMWRPTNVRIIPVRYSFDTVTDPLTGLAFIVMETPCGQRLFHVMNRVAEGYDLNWATRNETISV